MASNSPTQATTHLPTAIPEWVSTKAKTAITDSRVSPLQICSLPITDRFRRLPLSTFFHAEEYSIDRYFVLRYSVPVNSDFFENWVTQLRKGMLELCVMNAI